MFTVFIVLILAITGINIVLRLYANQQSKKYRSSDFVCKTDQECRIWARINNKFPMILCLGSYTCNTNVLSLTEGKCKFECGPIQTNILDEFILTIITTHQ